VKLLLDTHQLLWETEDSPRLSPVARRAIANRGDHLIFSVASLWEIAINHAKGLGSFQADPGFVREALLESGYIEFDVTVGTWSRLEVSHPYIKIPSTES
jgi:PIN domain nuclease of toxin-antitoxin system